MKNRNHVLTVAGIFLVLGLALYFVGAASFSGGRTGTAGGTITYQEDTYTAPAEDIQSIVIKARNMPVTVKVSQGNEVALSYYTSEEDPYEVSLENGVLTLKYTNTTLFSIGSIFANASIFGALNGGSLKVELTVPAVYAGSLRLETSNGTIAATGLAGMGDLTAETSNAAVNMTDISAKTVKIRTSNGAVTAERVLASGRLDAETSNGGVTARQTAAQDVLTITTSNGRITVDMVTSKAIELRSSNASVSGTVGGKRGDYTIASATSNGDNNLGSGGSGASRLTVNTSNGAINIRFSGE